MKARSVGLDAIAEKGGCSISSWKTLCNLLPYYYGSTSFCWAPATLSVSQSLLIV
jgi:hypothetical protein